MRALEFLGIDFLVKIEVKRRIDVIDTTATQKIDS